LSGSWHQDGLEQLARRARAGCSASFEELARRVSPSLLTFLRQRSASVQDAEDLRQETLLRVFQNLESYDPERPFGPWLMTIAARLAARRAQTRQARVDRTTEPLHEEAALAKSRADHNAELRETGEALWAVAARVLPAAQYRALRLRYVDELDLRSVAAGAGVTPGNARVLLLRARRRLMGSAQVRALLDARPMADRTGEGLPRPAAANHESAKGR